MDSFTSWKEIWTSPEDKFPPDTRRADNWVLIASALHWPLYDLGQGQDPHLVSQRGETEASSCAWGERGHFCQVRCEPCHRCGNDPKVTRKDCPITINKQIWYHIVFSNMDECHWSLKVQSLCFFLETTESEWSERTNEQSSETVHCFARRKLCMWTLFCVLEHVTRLRCFQFMPTKLSVLFLSFSWETVGLRLVRPIKVTISDHPQGVRVPYLSWQRKQGLMRKIIEAFLWCCYFISPPPS